VTRPVRRRGCVAVSQNERAVCDGTFKALIRKASFPWQRELFKHFVGGHWPDPISIPTGLGKASDGPWWRHLKRVA